MQSLFICDKGNEDILKTYISTIANAKNITLIPQGCLFDVSITDLIPLVYFNQICIKQFVVISSFDYNPQTIETDLIEVAKNTDFTDWLDDKHSFKVVCKIPEADTQLLSRNFGSHIFNQHESFHADMKKPSVQIRIQHVNGKIYVCYDLTGLNDEKREYKIFNSPTALRSTIAASLVYDIAEEKKILDPFCGSGTIVIEAALLRSKRSPHFYLKDEFSLKYMKPFQSIDIDNTLAEFDKNITKDSSPIIGTDILAKCVDSSKKNAKIAGVLKQINIFRADIDWIDMKFEENPVDIIVTNPPLFSEHNMDKVCKTYQQFFKRVTHILTANGEVKILTNNAQKVIELAKQTFAKYSTRDIFMGKTPLTIVSFQEIQNPQSEQEDLNDE